jgi:uncharacterized protein (DUF58 family)
VVEVLIGGTVRLWHDETTRMATALSSRSARLRHWARLHMREHITAAGAIYLGVMAFTGLAAFMSANNLLFLLLAAMLATLLVSNFLNRAGLVSLELDVVLSEHVSARQPTTARIRLTNGKRRLPSFSVGLGGVENSLLTTELYFPLIAGGATIETSVEVVFARRGLRSEDSFLFYTRFPFGFVERRARVTLKRDVLVYPALEPQAGFERLLDDVRGDAATLERGRGHDFHRIRPYMALESARHVDWRSTAHTGELQVREFAIEKEYLLTLVLDIEIPVHFEPWFERAVECCAYLAWHFSAGGARVAFRSQEFEILVPIEGDVHAVLRYLALVQPRGTAEPVREPAEESACVLFTTRPERYRTGWTGTRVMEPGRWPG